MGKDQNWEKYTGVYGKLEIDTSWCGYKNRPGLTLSGFFSPNWIDAELHLSLNSGKNEATPFGAIVVGTLMLALMNISGFKAGQDKR